MTKPERAKKPLLPGQKVDLGVELNGFTDRDGNPDNRPRDDDPSIERYR